MNKAKARRIIAITIRIDQTVWKSGCSEEKYKYIVNLTQNIRELLDGGLTDDEYEAVIANAEDYFDNDGNIRPCSLIH